MRTRMRRLLPWLTLVLGMVTAVLAVLHTVAATGVAYRERGGYDARLADLLRIGWTSLVCRALMIASTPRPRPRLVHRLLDGDRCIGGLPRQQPVHRRCSAQLLDRGPALRRLPPAGVLAATRPDEPHMISGAASVRGGRLPLAVEVVPAPGVQAS
jgi:hypothetical protein